MTEFLFRVLAPVAGLTWLALSVEAYSLVGRRSGLGRLVCFLDGQHLWVWVTLDDHPLDEVLHVVRCRRCGARL